LNEICTFNEERLPNRGILYIWILEAMAERCFIRRAPHMPRVPSSPPPFEIEGDADALILAKCRRKRLTASSVSRPRKDSSMMHCLPAVSRRQHDDSSPSSPDRVCSAPKVHHEAVETKPWCCFANQSQSSVFSFDGPSRTLGR
jgi:hypothetical protein